MDSPFKINGMLLSLKELEEYLKLKPDTSGPVKSLIPESSMEQQSTSMISQCSNEPLLKTSWISQYNLDPDQVLRLSTRPVETNSGKLLKKANSKSRGVLSQIRISKARLK